MYVCRGKGALVQYNPVRLCPKVVGFGTSVPKSLETSWMLKFRHAESTLNSHSGSWSVPKALKRAPSDPDKCYGAEVGRTSLVGYRNRSRSARSPNRRPFALRRIVPFASAPLLTASAAASAAGITCARHA